VLVFCKSIFVPFYEYGMTALGTFRKKTLNKSVEINRTCLQSFCAHSTSKTSILFQHHNEVVLRRISRCCCFDVQELRQKMDRHYSKGKPISFDAVALHDAAALLKLFLRELPEPLLMSERVNAFIQVDSKSCCQFFAV